MIVLLVPGAALLAWLPRDSHPRPAPLAEPVPLARPSPSAGPVMARALLLAGRWLRHLADAVALSVALASMLGMLQFFAGIRFSGLAVAALYAACLLAGLSALLWGRVSLAAPWSRKAGRSALLAFVLAVLLVGLFLAALLFWRFYQARHLALPVWVDPVHHTLLVRTIVEYGGLPPDYQPYIPAPFFYHYGFHLIAALFVFWSRLAPDQAVLWFGQVLNALVALSVFRAAVVMDELSRNQAQAAVEAVNLPDAVNLPEAAALPEAVEPPDADRLPEAARPLNAATLPLDGTLAEQDPQCAARPLRPAEPALPPRQLASERVLPVLRGLVAALLVTFAFQMPAYYLTWGRYTLLSGLILLGPLAAAALEAVREGSGNPTAARVRLALLTAGMCLTHYFALVLTGLFLLVVGLFRLAKFFECQRERVVLLKLAAWTALGVLFAAPWIYHVWQHNQAAASISMVSPLDTSEAAQQSAANYLNYFVYLIGPRRNHLLLGMAAVGLLFGALRSATARRWAVWGVLLVLLSLPWGLRFGPFRPDHFAIVLFFPAAIFLGGLVVDGCHSLAQVARPWLGRATLALLMAGFVAWGVRDTANIINTVTVLGTPADAAALDWIEENTPPTARFYINSTTWFTSGYRGVDGGYWITPYSGRGTIIPPFFYVWGPREYAQQVKDWGKRSAEINGCTPEFWALMGEANLQYVYLREGTGALQPSALQGCAGLQPVYNQGGVVIFEARQP